jgi:CubicO group peptidase (beta-lactamase class C family)
MGNRTVEEISMKNYFFISLLFLVQIGNAQKKEIKTIKGKQISINSLDSFIVKNMDSLQIPALSFAYIQNGKTVYYKNYGVKNFETKQPVNEATIFEACSMSKPVFSYFVLLLAQKKIIDLDKPLFLYYQDPLIDTSKSYYKLITARMILFHASGFPNWRKDEDFKNILYFENKPGTKYGYSGEGFQYLARVLGKILQVSDQQLNDMFVTEISKKLSVSNMNFTWKKGMENLKAYSHRNGKPTDNGSQGPKDWFGSAGSLHTNAKWYAKFINYFINHNSELSKQMLSLDSSMPSPENGFLRSFSFFKTRINNREIYFHSGNNGDTRSYCHFYKKEKIGIVMFSNCDLFFRSKFAEKLLAYLDEPFID